MANITLPKSSRTANRLDRSLARLLKEVRACRACDKELPFEPRPVLRATTTASLLIVGQAPGERAHHTGIPWNDSSGDRLRQWMGLDRQRFYDDRRIAIIPIGYCFPGRGTSGDLPPRKECSELWLMRLLRHLPEIRLTLLIGHYAQTRYLGSRRKATLTETVRAWREYRPHFLPLPHPSGRNNGWLRRNGWFEAELLPTLQRDCRRLVRT